MMSQHGDCAESSDSFTVVPIDTYRLALEQQPQRAAIHNNRANALLAEGRTAEAEASFRRAVTLDPGYAEAHPNLRAAYAQQERVQEATDCYETSSRLAKELRARAIRLGVGLATRGLSTRDLLSSLVARSAIVRQWGSRIRNALLIVQPRVECAAVPVDASPPPAPLGAFSLLDQVLQFRGNG
jgi:tetratricopeptide (TPR) repeat protein